MQLVRLSVAIALTGLVRNALGCGFEDPASATVQRGVLNLSYPNALYVIGAAAQARAAGILRPDPQTPEAKDMFAFHRNARMLERFGAERVRRGSQADPLVFFLVLVEPTLWTRFSVRGAEVETSVHVAGPEADRAVIVTSIDALKGIVDHGLTSRRAVDLGLIRVYGEPDASRRILEMITEEVDATAQP
jgi:hypothetical protein